MMTQRPQLSGYRIFGFIAWALKCGAICIVLNSDWISNIFLVRVTGSGPRYTEDVRYSAERPLDCDLLKVSEFLRRYAENIKTVDCAFTLYETQFTGCDATGLDAEAFGN